MHSPVDALQEAKQRVAAEARSRTGLLDLSGLNLRLLPDDVRALDHLVSLNCSDTLISDLGVVARLARLKNLNVSNTKVIDLSPISVLTSLQVLECSLCRVADLGPLGRLKALVTLDCSYTKMSDLAPLASATALRRLFCRGTLISDLGALRPLPALEHLDCSDCVLRMAPPAIWWKPSLHTLILCKARVPGLDHWLLSQSYDENCLALIRAKIDKPRRYGVSYAWNDSTPGGPEREADVDRICEEARERGLEILRDKKNMRIGDRITDFIDHLVECDRLFVFLSDKYLRSLYCMCELHRSWKRHSGESAIGRTIKIFVLPRTHIHDEAYRDSIMQWWEGELERRSKRAAAHGLHKVSVNDYGEAREIAGMLAVLPDILSALHGTLHAGLFDGFVRDGFGE